MVINMLQNLSHRYSSHNSNIKCVDLSRFHYIINLNVVSSSIVLSDLNSKFLAPFSGESFAPKLKD